MFRPVRLVHVEGLEADKIYGDEKLPGEKKIIAEQMSVH